MDESSLEAGYDLARFSVTCSHKSHLMSIIPWIRGWCECEGRKHSWHWLQTPSDASSYKHWPTEIPGKRKLQQRIKVQTFICAIKASSAKFPQETARKMIWPGTAALAICCSASILHNCTSAPLHNKKHPLSDTLGFNWLFTAPLQTSKELLEGTILSRTVP